VLAGAEHQGPQIPVDLRVTELDAAQPHGGPVAGMQREDPTALTFVEPAGGDAPGQRESERPEHADGHEARATTKRLEHNA